MLKLKINESFVEVRQNDKGLFCLNDIFRASGFGDNKKPSQYSRNLDGAILHRETEVVREGRTQVTYATKRFVYKYSAWIDDDFYDKVFEAFEAAASGDGKKAIDIATSVAIPQELVDKEKRLREKMNELLTEQYEGRKLTNMFTNFNRLIGKAVSGYTPKELTDGTLSTFKYIVEKGHIGGVSAYLATIEMINAGLVAGLDYQTIALMLQVETTKNKKLIKKVSV